MLCLGGFIGGFLVLGLDYMEGITNWQKVTSSIVATAFSGTLFVFLQFVAGKNPGEQVYMYPVGLLLAMLWYYGRNAGANMVGPTKSTRLIGWGHMLLLLSLSGIALGLVLFPAFRSVLGG
jgi:hypothetical protein